MMSLSPPTGNNRRTSAVTAPEKRTTATIWKSTCSKLPLTFLFVLLLVALKWADVAAEAVADVESGQSASDATTHTSSTNSNILNTLQEYDLQNDALIFAQVIYRHGDRMPIEPYAKDPWNDLKYWPNGWAQLTNIGKRQQYELGEWLRKRWNSLLSEHYDKDEIFIHSTDVDRTLMSALANLAGLYPPKRSDVWNSEILWQPIPVHTRPLNMDYILAAKVPCPLYEAELMHFERSDFYQQLYERYSYLFDYLTKYTGEQVNSFDGVQRINNTLFIEQLYNKTLPKWTKKVYPSDDMTYVSALNFQLATYTRPMARLKIGPLIREILERFQRKALGTLKPDRNVWMYSAHDGTVASILNALKLFEVHSPPYAACALLEMRLNAQKKPYISVFYKNTTAEPSALHIPDCGVACPLENMFKLYDDILPRNWEEECQMTAQNYSGTDIATSMGILVTVITILLFLTYVAIIYGRRRNYNNHIPYTQVD